MPLDDFEIEELNLDLENIRTGDQPDPRASLRAIIDDQKQKLVNLAIDIIQMGQLSPGEPIWVTPDPNNAGKQIVLEGNRRVAAIKLMKNPRLSEGTEVYSAFVQLSKDFYDSPIKTLEAYVFASREDAWPWIKRRHMKATSGVAVQRWRSLAKERARKGGTGPIRRSLIVLDHLDDGTEEYENFAEIIEEKSTTIDRVLNNPAMKTVLGISIDKMARSVRYENGNEIAGRRLLRDIISEFAKSDFKFSRIRDEIDRLNFINEFADRSVREKGETTSADTPTTTPPIKGSERPAPLAAKPGKGRINEPVRITLAPKSGSRTIAKVAGTRLNRIYKECREIRLDGNENAAAFLLRVFLELSSEAILTEKALPLPAKHAGKKTFWGEFGITLEDKINAVMPLIDVSRQTHSKLKAARIAIADKDREGSVDTLHQYIHNLDLTPSPEALRAAWDTWETYLTLLHQARK